MATRRSRFTTIITSIFLTILILEIGLRVFGAFYRAKASPEIRTISHSFTIVCVGDSFVYGIGAPSDKNFPRQLQDIFDQTGKKVTVVNRGMAGQNSAQLLKTLPEIIRSLKPDLIVILTGGANYWNFLGYRSLSTPSRKYGCSDFLYNIRVFKLIKLLWIKAVEHTAEKKLHRRSSLPQVSAFRPMEKLNDHGLFFPERRFQEAPVSALSGNGWRYADQNDFAAAQRCFEREIENQPAQSEGYAGLGWVYVCLRKFDQAYDILKKAIELQSDKPIAYYGLGIACQELGRFDESSGWFKEGIRRYPDEYLNYRGLGMLCQIQRKYTESIGYLKRCSELNPSDMTTYQKIAESYSKIGDFDGAIRFFDTARKRMPELKDMVRLFSKRETIDQEINAWIEKDITDIVRLCKKNTIAVVLQDYPHWWEGLQIILDAIAKREGIPLVANSHVFTRMLDTSAYSRFFAPDGHCNENGYGIMAKNIYETILQYRFLDTSHGRRQGAWAGTREQDEAK